MGKQVVLKGTVNTATVYTDQFDKDLEKQIIQLLNEPFGEGETIAIMPDTHIGKGAVIGTTMTTRNKKVSPNLVGVDIGCGIMVTKLKDGPFSKSDYMKLDQVIKEYVPSGFQVNKRTERFNRLNDLTFKLKKKQRIMQSIGSLGGGNHFIELAKNEKDEFYLAIHSGSRSLGLTVANHHQRLAKEHCLKKGEQPKVNAPALAYLEGTQLEDYLNDLYIAQEYAHQNRLRMTEKIIQHMGWTVSDQFDSVHNYIEPEKGILRKGATDASEGKRLIIPLNMRDGSIIAKGKGNPAWNHSAPHGAGRVLSRSAAKKELSFEFFQATMSEVYSTSVKKGTLDEAPMAYKEAKDIIDNIGDTVEILELIKPVYNFKGQ